MRMNKTENLVEKEKNTWTMVTKAAHAAKVSLVRSHYKAIMTNHLIREHHTHAPKLYVRDMTSSYQDK